MCRQDGELLVGRSISAMDRPHPAAAGRFTPDMSGAFSPCGKCLNGEGAFFINERSETVKIT